MDIRRSGGKEGGGEDVYCDTLQLARMLGMRVRGYNWYRQARYTDMHTGHETGSQNRANWLWLHRVTNEVTPRA
jgi:hypothetical protein